MNKINSVLLPGSFFEYNYIEKVNKLISFEIDTIYFYDHKINPADKNLDVYRLIDGIYKIYDIVKNEISLGVCVLNINSRPYQVLFDDYINKLLDIKNFKLGIGTGDNKFEKRKNFSNNIEEIITQVQSSKKFESNDIQLFIGGNSKEKLNLMKKYKLGINQWMGNKKAFKEKELIYGQIKLPFGRLSICLNPDNPIIIESNLSYEQIFVLKDSNNEIFYKTLDNIFK